MSDTQDMRQRYLTQPPATRMGHLASDLLRLSHWLRMPKGAESERALMEEIAWMLEHNPDFASEELGDMQREICHWLRVWPVEAAREPLAFRARRMSDRILDFSGLVDQESSPGVR